MLADTTKNLTYVLTNGYEKTIELSLEKLIDFVKWFYDSNSQNSYDVKEGISEQTTFYKDTLLFVSY